MSGDFSECQGFGGWQTESLNFDQFTAFHRVSFSLFFKMIFSLTFQRFSGCFTQAQN